MKRKTKRGVRDRLPGFEWNSITKIANFDVWERKSAGQKRHRISVTAATQEEAVTLWKQYRQKVKGGSVNRSGLAPTFSEFIIENFDTICAQLKPKTAREYGYVIGIFGAVRPRGKKKVGRPSLLTAFGALRLSEISSAVINKWSASLLGRGYAGATVNNYVNTMCSLISYAVELGGVEESPLKKDVKKYKVNKPCNELSDVEEERFIAAFADEQGFRAYIAECMPRGTIRLIPPDRADALVFGRKRVYGAAMHPESKATGIYFRRYQSFGKPFFTVALHTGLRWITDLLPLRWSVNIDEEAGVIRTTTGKTGREVAIPISRKCWEALQQFKARRGNADFVFVDEEGHVPAIKTIRRYFRIAKWIAGMKARKFRIHDVRHTFGSKLLRRGVNIKFVSTVMAHSSLKMTERYARPGDAVLGAVVEALDQ
jgi:integrase